MKRIVFVLSILFSINSLFAQVFPNADWIYNENYAGNGWSEPKLKEFQQFLKDSTHITGLVIVHKGQIVYDFGDIEENSYIASCRKSVLAMLYGKYVENNQIDLDMSLKELDIDDVAKLSSLEKSTTIRNLISARSGVYLIGSNPGDSRKYAPKRDSKTPGSYWLYSNWDFNLAGHIFEMETGKNIYDEVESQFAIPLKMQDWDRSLQTKYGDATISIFPAYHMWFSTRDLARLGLLMLNNGKWNDDQLISMNWVSEMTSQISTSAEINKNDLSMGKLDTDFGYGYMWWLWENSTDKRLNNAYSAFGAYGQSITIYPEIDVVVAFKTNAKYRKANSMTTVIKILKQAIENFEGE
jgi:CubicO group peptidase (beta-lactamase class C family)